MTGAIRHKILGVLAAVLLLVSCKPGVPGDYLQPGKMADILYEYHLAQALFSQQGGDSLTLLSYRAGIFKKYGVTEAEFDSSMVYYTRHTRQLYDVYKKVGDRMSADLVAQGGTSGALAQYGTDIASGDTASIWKGDMCFALTPYQSANIYSFEAKADTSYHKGDRIMLDFDSQFIYQEGVRNAAAVLTVTFGNDSTATEVRQLMSSSHYHIQIEDSRKLGIKGVKGFFMLGNSADEGPSTTLRLAVFYNVQLLKMHVHDAPAAETGPAADSAGMRRADSLRRGAADLPKPRMVPDGNTGIRTLKPIKPVKELPMEQSMHAQPMRNGNRSRR